MTMWDMDYSLTDFVLTYVNLLGRRPSLGGETHCQAKGPFSPFSNPLNTH